MIFKISINCLKNYFNIVSSLSGKVTLPLWLLSHINLESSYLNKKEQNPFSNWRNRYTSSKAIANGLVRLATECFLNAPIDFKKAIRYVATVNDRLDVFDWYAVVRGVDKESVLGFHLPRGRG